MSSSEDFTTHYGNFRFSYGISLVFSNLVWISGSVQDDAQFGRSIREMLKKAAGKKFSSEDELDELFAEE
jgi:hypothetical protein